MGKIFKQLARHWAACLAVVALLFVQAYCDLSLPDYTSKIVDTGIQQGGIESPLPETVRQSTLDALSLLMSEEDADALQNAYGYYLQDNGVLKLRRDVYKRQAVGAEIVAAIHDGQPGAELTLAPDGDVLHDDRAPVSYTHLDVYKRQLHIRGHRAQKYAVAAKVIDLQSCACLLYTSRCV